MRFTIVFAWLGALVLLFLAVIVGAPFSVFIDLPSILIVGLGGACLSIVAAPLSQHVRAFRLGLGEAPVDAADARAARAALRAQALSVLGLGVMGDLIGLVQMLQNLSDPSALGPALAVNLLTVLYAAGWCTVVVWPLDASIARRTARGGPQMEGPGAGAGAVVGLAALAFVLAEAGSSVNFGVSLAMAVP